MKRKIALILAAVFVVTLCFAYVASKSAEANDVYAQTYQFLTDEGFTPVQASGIMGTIKINSNFDPTATAPNDLGYGLFQWVDFRLERLEKFAMQIGKPIDSTETQLLFMIEELDTYWRNSDNAYGWENFIEAETPSEAAQIFYEEYTGPMSNNRCMEMVGTFAEEFYEQYAT